MRQLEKFLKKKKKKIKKDKNYTIKDSTKNKIFQDIENILKNYKIKLASVLLFQLVMILFFWYFITAFCQVYRNTQKYLLLNIRL